MKRWQLVVGIILMFFGIIALVEALYNVNISRFYFPLLLIGIGVILLLRPKITGSDVDIQIPVLGDQRKEGTWTVHDQEIWWFVGSNRFDFTQAVFPQENSKININGFVVDIKVILPDHIGVKIIVNSFVPELNAFNQKDEQFLSQLIYRTPNYDQAANRVTIQTVAFVSEVKVKPSLIG